MPEPEFLPQRERIISPAFAAFLLKARSTMDRMADKGSRWLTEPARSAAAVVAIAFIAGVLLRTALHAHGSGPTPTVAAHPIEHASRPAPKAVISR